MIIKKLKVVKKVKKNVKAVKRGKHKPAKLTDNKNDIVEQKDINKITENVIVAASIEEDIKEANAINYNKEIQQIKKSDDDIEVSDIYANKNLTVNELQGTVIFVCIGLLIAIITLASIYIYGQEK